MIMNEEDAVQDAVQDVAQDVVTPVDKEE